VFGGGGGTKSPFGTTAVAPATTNSPFNSTTASNNSVFGGGGETKSPFGTTSAAPATTNSPFNSTTAFGGGSSGSSAFGVAPAASAPFSGSAFGSTPAASGSPFGQASATSASTAGPAASSSRFSGRNPRDILVSFYQTKDPSKLSSVDKILTKYAGNEEKLFLNLAKKYNLDPKEFGVVAPQPTVASAQATPSFGSLGMGNNTGFSGGGGPSFGGGGPSGAFSAPSGFGASAKVDTFAASSGFGSTAKVGGFGSLASSAPVGSGFGGFGGGTSGAPSFGSQATQFGGARR